MGNVTEFKQTSQALVKAGAYFFERNLYADAIDCLYRAHLKDETDSEIMSDIGDVYMAVGDPFQALDWYVRALHANPSDENVYGCLIKCCADMGDDMREAAYYYFAMGRNRGIMTPEELEALGEFEDDEEAIDENVKVGSVGDAMRYQRGQKCLREHALSAAYMMFASVSKEDVHYKNARRLMLKIDVERERFGDAAELADELLEYDDEDTEALIYGAEAYHELGVTEKCDDYYARAQLDKESSCDDIETLARVAWHMGRYDEALKHLLTVKNFLPWDREILMQIAMCYANLGNRDAAKYYIVLVKRLYPDDTALKYYAEEIDAMNGKCRFEPLDCIPEAEAIEREDDIYDWMVSHKSVNAAMNELKKNPVLSDYLNWLFQEGDRDLQIATGKYLAGSEKNRAYLEKLLISSYMSDEFKKNVLFEMLREKPPTIAVMTGSLYRRIEYAPPADLHECTLELYRYTFVSLMFYGDGYTDDMNGVYKKLDETLFELNMRKTYDVPSMAAAICYRSNKTRKKLSKEDCVYIFGCNKNKFEQYIDSEIASEIKTIKKQPRPKRKRRI